jgi:hypothetical protein
MKAPQLVARYNALVVQATTAGLTGYRELRLFHDRTTALARIAQLEGALAAHASGEKAEDKREEEPELSGRAFLQSLQTDDDQSQENEVTPKSKAKKAAKKAKKTKKTAAPTKTNGLTVRAGSKTAIIHGLLSRKSGCTAAEVLAATGWPSVSMPAMAKACGLKLRKDKEKGQLTQFYGS